MRFKKAKGFTLIEVMTAVVVLGIGVGAVMLMISTGLSSISITTQLTIKSNLARLAMNDIENLYLLKKAEDVKTSGTFDDNPDYTYSVKITKDIDEKIKSLHRIDLVVNHRKHGEEKSFKISTELIDFSQN